MNSSVANAPSGVAADSDAMAGMPKLFSTAPVSTLGVLHLINGEYFSGAERVQQILGLKLPEQRVDAHFVCLKPKKFPEMSGLEASHVHSLPMRSRTDLTVFKQVADLARDVKANLLHAHTPRTAMIASLVSKRTGIPWVFHVHSPTARDSTRWAINRINHLVERWSLWNCDHIITVSKSLRRDLLSRGVSRFDVSCIPNGVANQIPIEATSRTKNQHWKLGMVALVRPRKGIECLLEAMAQVKRTNPNVTLDVVGAFETASYENEVRELHRKLGLESTVRFLGFRTDIPDVMRELDALVLPSLFGEGMPMVVLEALAVGVPVIATRVEGTPEVVRDDLEGYLAAPADPSSLAASITKMVSSRDRWCEMSETAFLRQRERFSDVQMAARTAEIYRRIVG